MGEKREIVCRYVGNGLTVSVATSIAGIKRSTYYYRPNGRPKGKRPSTHTLSSSSGLVTNEVVVNEIIQLISPEFHDYGYQTVAPLLKRDGYVINHKKVWRLMRDNQLLHPPRPKAPAGDKMFIQYTVPPLEGPFTTVEADIKYVYIHGSQRNAFLISFLCTFCRGNPVWALEYTMRSSQIEELLKEFVNHPEVKKYIGNQPMKMKIRTDNGPQFIAKKLAETLKSMGLEHEFIKPGVPQQNAHIESFHSLVTRLVCNKHIFRDLDHARGIFRDFFYAYNYTRVMRALLCYPPMKFLKVWESGVVGIKRDKKNREVFFFREKPALEKETGPSSEALLGHDKFNTFNNQVLTTKENSPVL